MKPKNFLFIMSDEHARADQVALIAKHGGCEELLKRGDFEYPRAPGQTPEFSA